jgi:cytoskeletal protein CcmA (bactofilin family)
MKDKKMEESKITGFFDQGSEFDGVLKYKGAFRIDGTFKGKIESESTLVIGDNGRVEAEVNVAHVVISGEFRGDIKASEKVEINSHGRIFGTITTPKLTVEEGAYLEARCQTIVQQPGVGREAAKVAEK